MPGTPPIIASFIRDFATRNDLQDLDESEQFEHLLSWLLFRSSIHDRFATTDVTTGAGETGIDGACVVLDGNLILTADDAEQFFSGNKPSSSIVAELLFHQAKLSQSFSREGILGFGTAIVELLGDEDSATPQDGYLEEVAAIYQVLLKNAAKLDLTRATCRAFFCCLGEWRSPAHPSAALQRLRDELKDLDFFAKIEVDPIDRNMIRDLWNDATRAQEATLPTVARFPFPAMPGVDNAVVALVKAQDFVDKVIRDNYGKVRIGIFDQNIRDFEGLSNSVNQKIRKTVDSDEARQRFGIMNNGVTIIAKDMWPAADSYVLKNYQIINGCQTSNVLERSRSQITESVLLQVRLIQTTDPDILNDVVEATNSQTTVPPYQFVANSPLAVETQEFFRSYPDDPNHRLHFERRKSELSDATISNTRIVTIQHLAQTFGAIFLEEPHVVAKAPNQAFSVFRDRLFQNTDSPLMYYTSAFAHYRVFLLKVQSRLRISHRRLYWHVLTAAKRIAVGKLSSNSSRKQQDKYCNAFLERLWEPADALELFEEAYQAIQDETTHIDRDRLGRQAFTSEYLSKL